jgi:hypothetical protein
MQLFFDWVKSIVQKQSNQPTTQRLHFFIPHLPPPLPARLLRSRSEDFATARQNGTYRED